MYKNFLLPVGLLSGTIIGAGIFSLPYVFSKSGILIGFFYLVIGAAAYVLMHLMYADIILRTKEEKRFVGYTREYLGNWAFAFSILMTVVEMIFVLTIYLVLSVSFFNLITSFGVDLEKLLIFWFLGSMGIFLSLKKLATLEFWITGGIAAIIFLIFGIGAAKFSGMNFFELSLQPSDWLLPLAPVLFALSGRVAIPSLVNYFKGAEGRIDVFSIGKLKQAIVWGTVFPALVYGLFVLGVVGATANVSHDAVSGLVGQVSPNIILSIGVLGLLSLFSSYIVVGLDVKNILAFDLKFPKTLIFLAIVFGPLIPYFLGFNNFIDLVSFAGGIFLALEGLFVVFMWIAAGRRAMPPILLKKGSILAIMFVGCVFLSALIYEVVKYV